MKKRAVYYSDLRGNHPVLDFIQELSLSEQEKCFEYIEHLERSGEETRRPVSAYLGWKIYELRPRSNRILYFFMLKDYAVLVHAIKKKTHEIPHKDIQLAVKRMNDYMLRYEQGFIQLGD